jgi:hypothetical protein
MEGGITDDGRSIMLRAAVARVGREEMKAGLASTADPRFAAPKAVRNALNALQKQKDPVGAVMRAPYRAAVPYLAAAIADDCLSSTIEELGDASDDPTREQLLAALDRVHSSYSDTVVAVMLATVAAGGMPASDLCFDILAVDERFGLTDRSEYEPITDAPGRLSTGQSEANAEQREARRLKKQKDADNRRKRMEATRKAGEQVRQARKQGRASRPAASESGSQGAQPAVARTVPRWKRKATLTPLEEAEFDRDDPWTGGVVYVWVPFDGVDSDGSTLDGKSRRCVVVAGSPTHLLVRPGYSVQGSKSRDWTSVSLRQWRQAGFDRPTWIDVGSLRVPRDEAQPPSGWLTQEDWNALW